MNTERSSNNSKPEAVRQAASKKTISASCEKQKTDDKD